MVDGVSGGGSGGGRGVVALSLLVVFCQALANGPSEAGARFLSFLFFLLFLSLVSFDLDGVLSFQEEKSMVFGFPLNPQCLDCASDGLVEALLCGDIYLSGPPEESLM
jgi:hypothetical protein